MDETDTLDCCRRSSKIHSGGALHLDRAICEHCSQCTNGGENRRDDRPNHADRQRKLRDRPLLLFDDNPADVALVQQLLHRINELSGGDLERFLERRLIHGCRYVLGGLLVRNGREAQDKSSSARERFISPRPRVAGLQPKLSRTWRGASKNRPGTTSVDAVPTRCRTRRSPSIADGSRGKTTLPPSGSTTRSRGSRAKYARTRARFGSRMACARWSMVRRRRNAASAIRSPAATLLFVIR